MNKSIHRIIFFFGWLLSPLTFWNDAFINIPLAYLLANLAAPVMPFDFLTVTIICYWLTNVAGLVLMAVSGQRIFTGRDRILRESVTLIATMLIYSAILLALGRFGILRPLKPIF